MSGFGVKAHDAGPSPMQDEGRLIIHLSAINKTTTLENSPCLSIGLLFTGWKFFWPAEEVGMQYNSGIEQE